MMETVEDPMWYRVAALRPRLRLRVRVQRRVMRGVVWYVLIDDERRRVHRLDAAAYQVIGRLDGSLSVDEAWRIALARLGEAAPTQGETLRFLSQLSSAELLTIPAQVDARAIVQRRREQRNVLQGAIANPLSFNVPLCDPSRWLLRARPLAHALFSPVALVLWLAAVLAASLLAAAHAGELRYALSAQAHSAGFLLRMWLLYPLVKLVHEACHALAVRRWDGEVRELGMSLVMFNPLPYVDASAANAFASRRQRMVVSAAGVMAEVGCAAAALFLWHASSSPSLQTLALAVVAACGLSTLLFNANPLARFDGYYLLCDLLDLPNLHQRGRALLAYRLQALLGMAADVPYPETSRREAVAVTAYAALSWIYQAVVSVSIAYWIAGPYPLVALLVAMASAWQLLGRPLAAGAAALFSDPRFNGRRQRAFATSAAVVGALAVGIFVVPAPSFVVQEGVVWTPPAATLRVQAPGELSRLQAQPSRRIEAGQVVAQLDNLELRSERESTYAKWRQLDVQYVDAMLTDPLQARKLAFQRDAVKTDLARLDGQLAALTVRALSAGLLVVPDSTAQQGHFYQRGDDLGYVLPDEPGMLVKLALSESDAALVRGQPTRVSVRLVSRPAEELPARLERETPDATRSLPSAVLGSAAGGPIANDPDDTSGRRAATPVVIFDVRIPGRRVDLLGARAWVRIDHASEPLARQWERSLRQAFLARTGGSA